MKNEGILTFPWNVSWVVTYQNLLSAHQRTPQ